MLRVEANSIIPALQIIAGEIALVYIFLILGDINLNLLCQIYMQISQHSENKFYYAKGTGA